MKIKICRRTLCKSYLFYIVYIHKIFIFVKSDREMTYVIFQPGSLTKKHIFFDEGQNVERVMGGKVYGSLDSAIEKRTLFPPEEAASLQSFFSNRRTLNCLFRCTPYDGPPRPA